LVRVSCVEFSPDSQLLLVADYGRTTRIYDAATGALAAPPLQHPYGVLDAAFGPDGRRIATACEDGQVRLWEAATGAPLAPPMRVDPLLHRVRFVDEHRVVAISERSWSVLDFSPDSREIADLRRIARVLSCSDLEPSRGLEPLDAPAFLAAWRALREHDPEAVAVTEPQAIAWHEARAEDGLRDQQWDAAAFHFGQLIEAEPARADHRRHRGDAFALAGDWERAAADYADAVERDPDDAEALARLALLRLELGDADAYRSACSELLDRFGDTDDPESAAAVVLACTAVPDATDDPGRLPRLAEVAATVDPGATWTASAQAAAFLRAGDATTAAPFIRAAALGDLGSTREFSPASRIEARSLLAIGEHHLGHPDAARRWLDSIDESLGPGSEDGLAAQYGQPWDRLLHARLLRREAEALLDAASPDPDNRTEDDGP
jgi:tetratricopeptide (TPR) repeat protein